MDRKFFGEKIAPFKGIETEQHNIGESWELSGVKGNESVVSEGELAGRTITDLIDEYKGALVGGKVYAENGNVFPLLIKFIDARSDLSIQVHPDDKLAAERHNSKGKTEMWYVVGADEGAHLLSGLNRDLTPEEYVSMVENNTITDALTDFKVKPGDVFFLPAGRIHAIGTGCRKRLRRCGRLSPRRQVLLHQLHALRRRHFPDPRTHQHHSLPSDQKILNP